MVPSNPGSDVTSSADGTAIASPAVASVVAYRIIAIAVSSRALVREQQLLLGQAGRTGDANGLGPWTYAT